MVIFLCAVTKTAIKLTKTKLNTPNTIFPFFEATFSFNALIIFFI